MEAEGAELDLLRPLEHGSADSLAHTRESEYTSKYSDAPKDRQGLFAAMAMQDDAVGIVLEKLRGLKAGENTLILYISDNGGQRYQGRNAKWQCGSENKPVRGSKDVDMRGGIRVPYLVQWKGRLPAGKTYGRPVISLDGIPTALAAAGATPIPGYDLDGVNLRPFLKCDWWGRKYWLPMTSAASSY